MQSPIEGNHASYAAGGRVGATSSAELSALSLHPQTPPDQMLIVVKRFEISVQKLRVLVYIHPRKMCL